MIRVKRSCLLGFFEMEVLLPSKRSARLNVYGGLIVPILVTNKEVASS